jgi:hypothetical protein
MSAAARELPDVSLSIVSHGHQAELRALLESLAEHERANRIQLILTDNLGSDLPDTTGAAWWSVVTRRNDRPQGFASNHNAAFNAAEAEYFGVLNPDVLFLENTLDPLLQQLQGGAADIVAPLIIDAGGQVLDSFRELPSPWGLLRRRLDALAHYPALSGNSVLRPDWIAGTFLLMRRRTFSGLGGFNPSYHLYFEDVDLCTRARLQGLSLLVDTHVRVQHDARRASRRPGRPLLWHTQSALRFFTSSAYRRARALKANR